MVENSRRTIIIVGLFALLLVLAFGVTYAAFSARVTGLENASVISLDGGEMWIDIDGGPDIVANNLIPDNDHPWVTKTITLTGKNNTGDLQMPYSIYLVVDNNTFVTTPMVYTLEAINNSNNGLIIPSVEKKTPLSETIKLGSGIFEQGENLIHTYILKIYFPDTGVDQSVDMRALFAAHIDINGHHSRKVINCTYDGELVAGAEYVNGQYTYHYLEEYNETAWASLSSDGWGVVLTDVATNSGVSTAPVTGPVCTFINGIPVISANSMYYNSKATSIDLSQFNTSYIKKMYSMFRGTAATALDLSNFETSNVSSMGNMFRESAVTSLDLSTFDTSKVTSMSFMFADSSATTINSSSFDTSKVKSMKGMYQNSKVQTLNLTNFDTSSVTTMNQMFRGITPTSIDLSSFDTSNVTDMNKMFYGVTASMVDLKNFDTSNVTDMTSMFYSATINNLDITDWNVKNVTTMAQMFKTSNISNFKASALNSVNVTDMENMFQGANLKGFTTFSIDLTKMNDIDHLFYQANLPATVTVILNNSGNLTNMKNAFSSVTVTNLTVVANTSNVTTMENMFDRNTATTITITSFNTSKVTSMYLMFNRATNLKTIYVSNTWNTSKVTKSTDMFYMDTKLKNFNSNYTDKTRAHYNTNGYLTYKANS